MLKNLMLSLFIMIGFCLPIYSAQTCPNENNIDFNALKKSQSTSSFYQSKCGQCAVKSAKYLLSEDPKFLKKPTFLEAVTKKYKTGMWLEDMKVELSKGSFLNDVNKEIIYMPKETAAIDDIKIKLKQRGNGTVAVAAAYLKYVDEEGEVGVGHTIVMYMNGDELQVFDITSPERFDSALYNQSEYFNNGFYSHSMNKNVKFIDSFEYFLVVNS